MYGRVVACSKTDRDEKLMTPCPPAATELKTRTSTPITMSASHCTTSNGTTLKSGRTSKVSSSDNKRSVSSGGLWSERRRIQIEKARKCIRQNFGTEHDEDVRRGAEEVRVCGEKDEEMEEEDEARSSKKWGSGRKGVKIRNPFIKEEGEISKITGEVVEDDDDD